jgi:hypothetical protein
MCDNRELWPDCLTDEHPDEHSVWVSTMHQCAAVHLALSSLTGLHHTVQEHVDIRFSRASRDCTDMQKLLDWLDGHDPFQMPDDKLYSLSSGLVANDEVTCDTAEELGALINQRLDGLRFDDIVLKRSNQIKTIAQMQQLDGSLPKKSVTNASNLFYRLLIQVERSADIHSNFSHELTAEPTALFRNNFMRKPDKPAILRHVLKDMTQPDTPSDLSFVVDGGALLHRVLWVKRTRFAHVLRQYSAYVKSKYGRCPVVVFDGYGQCQSTKDHEHMRRSLKSVSKCPDVRLDEQSPVIFEQHAFLANNTNKDNFIQLLMSHLDHEGCRTIQSEGDADIDIVKEALTMASKQQGPIAVVGDDTDLLVLLTHHLKENMSDVWFWSEAKRSAQNATEATARPISIRSLQRKLGTTVCQQLLVLHAFSGCDTTSAVNTLNDNCY